MKPSLVMALFLTALGAGAARAEEDAAPASAPNEPAPPESLEEFLDEKGDDGKPVVGADARAYLAKLPEKTRKLLGDAGGELIGGPKHLQNLLSLGLSPPALELALQDRCVMCHTDLDNQKPELTFSSDPEKNGSPHILSLKELVSDVHFRKGLSCSGCHGGDPAAPLMGAEISKRWPHKDVRHKDRTWIPEFCARCHADPAFMRGFNPALPTDQLAKYKESRHGQLVLAEKDSNAAQCVSCHGVHGIRGPTSRQSMVHAQRIPETCGACHADAKHMAGYKNQKGEPLPTNQLAQYKQSVHGKALLEKGDLNAAACNDCHGNHAAMPPSVASVSQVCRTCHLLNGQLFDGSKHKEAFTKHGWPECGQCHGKHDIEKPSDALISTARGGLCNDCHDEFAKDQPKCKETANYFRASIQTLDEGAKKLDEAGEHLAENGLDVEPLAFKTSDLKEALVQSRAKIHTFDKGSFDVAAGAGRAALSEGDKLVVAAHEEYGFRRKGLMAAVAFMGLLALAIYLKTRQMERRASMHKRA